MKHPWRLSLIALFSLILSILPWPEFLQGANPPWVLLLLIYLQCYNPRCFSLSLLFILGFGLDLLLSTTLGEHALALTLVCWFFALKMKRFYFYSLEQQMLILGLFCGFYQLILSLIDLSLGFNFSSLLSIFFSLVASLLAWPWLRWILDAILPQAATTA